MLISPEIPPFLDSYTPSLLPPPTPSLSSFSLSLSPPPHPPLRTAALHRTVLLTFRGRHDFDLANAFTGEWLVSVIVKTCLWFPFTCRLRFPAREAPSGLVLSAVPPGLSRSVRCVCVCVCVCVHAGSSGHLLVRY